MPVGACAVAPCTATVLEGPTEAALPVPRLAAAAASSAARQAASNEASQASSMGVFSLFMFSFQKSLGRFARREKDRMERPRRLVSSSAQWDHARR